jgi:hypothetical protein
MSGLTDLSSLLCAFSECKNFETSIPGSSFLILLDFYPIGLTLGLAGIAVYKQELYLLLFSLSLSLNWLINLFFQQVAFRQEGAFPGCGSRYQMPSFSSQQIVCFQTMVAFYTIAWTRRVFYLNSLSMHCFSALVVFARTFIGINTVAQLMAGAGFGFVDGILFHCIIYFLIFPNFKAILGWRFSRWKGVVDTLCREEKKNLPTRKK